MLRVPHVPLTLRQQRSLTALRNQDNFGTCQRSVLLLITQLSQNRKNGFNVTVANNKISIAVSPQSVLCLELGFCTLGL